MKNTFKLVSIIIGTIIGAGFASGKEIYIFFAKYGIIGIVGVVISITFTTIIIYKTLSIIKKEKIENYNEFLNYINSKGTSNKSQNKSQNESQNKSLNKSLNKNQNISKIVNLFLIISFLIMISGFFSFILQEYGSKFAYIFTIIFVVVCYIIFINKTKAIANANQVLVPILVGVIAVVGILNMIFFAGQVVQNTIISNNYNTVGSQFSFFKILEMIANSILYASYNSIILIPVLTNFKDYINSSKTITIVSTVILLLLSLSIFGLLLRGIFYAQELDFPIIEIVKEFGYNFKYAYEAVIIFSIFTSAISTGFSFLENVVSQKENKAKNLYSKIALIICVISIFTAQIGFSNLVKILYPIFGILGLVQIKLLKNR